MHFGCFENVRIFLTAPVFIRVVLLYQHFTLKRNFFSFFSFFFCFCFAATEFEPLPVQRSSRVGSLFSNEEHKKDWFMTCLLFCHTYQPCSWRHSDTDCCTQTNSTHGSYFRNSGTWLKTIKTREKMQRACCCVPTRTLLRVHTPLTLLQSLQSLSFRSPLRHRDPGWNLRRKTRQDSTHLHLKSQNKS